MPFEVPSSWVWCELGSVNEIARGGSPRPIKDYLTDAANGINWIKIGDTKKDGKYIDSVKEKIIPEGVKKSRMVHKGDFLLTNSMSFGRPYILNVDGCIHDGWLVISPLGKVYTSDFLYYLLSSSFAFEQFTNVASGGVVTNLNSDKVARTKFPLPPYEEQKRIVIEIEHWFALIDIIEHSKANLQANIKFAKSKVLDLAIHGKLVPQDPTDEPASELLKRINPKAEITCDNGHYQKLPKGWCLCDLSSLCKIKGGKRIPRGRTFSKERTPHIYIRVSDMKNNTIITTDLKYIDDDVYQTIKNYTISSSDLYLTIAGTIGHVGIVPKQFDGMNLTENAVKLTGIICDKKYLLYSLLSSTAQEHFKSRFHQVAQPKLSIETASSTMIYLPPLKEQHRIVAKIEEIFAQLDAIEASL